MKRWTDPPCFVSAATWCRWSCAAGPAPLVLRRFQLDPALASGPVLTTITDMCGFLLVLSLAGLWLGRLV